MPAAAAVTLTVMSQLPPAGMVAPGLMPMLPPFAAPPVKVPWVTPAVQEMLGAGVAVLVRPGG